MQNADPHNRLADWSRRLSKLLIYYVQPPFTYDQTVIAKAVFAAIVPPAVCS